MPAAARRHVAIPRTVGERPPALGAVVHALAGGAMGTGWSLRVAGAPGLDLDTLRRGVQGELDDVVAQMSHWSADSDLGRFNCAPAGSWHALPRAFFDVLDFGLQVAERSEGAFDPAAGALVDAWGFGAHGTPQVPSPDVLARARAAGGWRRLALDPATRRACQPGGLALDLSAIAKGHAVDRVSGWLAARGHVDHLVEVGGELKGAGVKPDGQPWWVALEAVEGETDEWLVALHGLAVATSGDYRRVFVHDGERLSHTIDPRDGRPIRHGVASVSVLHAQAMAADAWSTALTVLGPEQGPRLAATLGLAARFVVRGDAGLVTHASPALAALLA